MRYEVQGVCDQAESVADEIRKTRGHGNLVGRRRTHHHPSSPSTHLNGFTKRDEEGWHAKVFRGVVVAEGVVGVFAAARIPAILAAAVTACGRKRNSSRPSQEEPRGPEARVCLRLAVPSRTYY